MRSRNTDVRKSVSRRGVGRWAIAASVAAAVLAAFAALQPGPLKRGLLGAVLPTGYVERVNELELKGISPADGSTCFVGEPVNIVAAIRNDDHRAYRGEVIFRDLPPRAMTTSADGNTFILAGQKFEQSFEFAVKVGPSRWPTDKAYYKVNVLPRVKIDGLDLSYEYPGYTKLPPREVRNAPGAIEAVVGTRVTVTLRTAVPVKSVAIERQDGARIVMTPAAEHKQFLGPARRAERRRVPGGDRGHAAAVARSRGRRRLGRLCRGRPGCAGGLFPDPGRRGRAAEDRIHLAQSRRGPAARQEPADAHSRVRQVRPDRRAVLRRKAGRRAEGGLLVHADGGGQDQGGHFLLAYDAARHGQGRRDRLLRDRHRQPQPAQDRRPADHRLAAVPGDRAGRRRGRGRARQAVRRTPAPGWRRF